MRFLAAAAVTFEHARTLQTTVYNGGGAFGVDVFFVLSGFVISRSAEIKPEGFLRARLTRIFPGYWLWAAGWLALAAAGGRLDPLRLFATLTLIPSPRAPVTDSYVLVSWTLSYELMFYAAVWLALRGVRPRWLILAYGAAFALGLATQAPLIRFIGSPMVVEFLLGVCAYRIGRRGKTLGWAALAGALALWMAAPKALGVAYASQDAILGSVRAIVWGAAAFLTVWGAAHFDCSGPAWRPLVALGDASYSLYLGHLLIFIVLSRLTGGLSHPVAATALAAAIALPVYTLAERPLMHAARRLVGMDRGPEPLAAAGIAGRGR